MRPATDNGNSFLSDRQKRARTPCFESRAGLSTELFLFFFFIFIKKKKKKMLIGELTNSQQQEGEQQLTSFVVLLLKQNNNKDYSNPFDTFSETLNSLLLPFLVKSISSSSTNASRFSFNVWFDIPALFCFLYLAFMSP